MFLLVNFLIWQDLFMVDPEILNYGVIKTDYNVWIKRKKKDYNI